MTALLATAVLLILLAATAHAGLSETLAAFDAAYGATAEALAKPARIGQVDENGELISFYWQQGKYREEYHWLGFTEVFGYDGASHWYGSDINLPYALDGGAPPSITLELARSFAFLKDPWRSNLREPSSEDVRAELASARSVGNTAEAPPTSAGGDKLPPYSGFIANNSDSILFSPPGMAEALLALDGEQLHVYIGDKRSLSDSRVFTETVFGRLGQYAGAAYPITLTTRTHEGGKVVRSRSASVTAVDSIAELPPAQFTAASSPPVSSPQLPTVPYSVAVKISDGAVIVPCSAPDGTTLNLALDTGGNIGLLRRSVVERIGLKPAGSEQISGHGATAQVGYVRADGLRIGEAPIPAWPAAVLQSSTGLDNKLGFAGVDGLLGNHLLHNYVVQIDYPAGQLRLWPREQFDPRAVASAFAAQLYRERLPWSEVLIDGKIRGGAFFNTGGRYVFGLAFWACDDAGITYPVESMGRGVSVGGSSMFGLIRPGEVRLLGMDDRRGGAQPPPAQSQNSNGASVTSGGRQGGPPTDMVLHSPLTTLELLAPGEPMQRYRVGSFGSLFLRDYVVTFDLAGEKVYLQRQGKTQ